MKELLPPLPPPAVEIYIEESKKIRRETASPLPFQLPFSSSMLAHDSHCTLFPLAVILFLWPGKYFVSGLPQRVCVGWWGGVPLTQRHPVYGRGAGSSLVTINNANSQHVMGTHIYQTNAVQILSNSSESGTTLDDTARGQKMKLRSYIWG